MKLTPLQRERYYPYVGGMVAFAVVLWIHHKGYSISYSENMLASLVSLGGIFAGFLATVKTLLLTMSGPVQKRLNESGYIEDLLRYLREGIYGSLLLCILAMVGFANAIKFPEIHAALLFGLLSFALLALYRITRISVALLVSNNSDDPDEE
ncbi:hypothetical protein INQ41_04905 [Lysobacter ciconiae]|uniref:Uncharacterized protein n=1 Tax=Novilysobacter ciconiae TaxID=2781022 RepID=A0A7S6UHF4_9GAMM|nr:hypothetical protein [Lysobacter ciconiae]QOW20365.1 hypothetical protein INQ41_04905 [Lysobacter ciconiae]